MWSFSLHVTMRIPGLDGGVEDTKLSAVEAEILRWEPWRDLCVLEGARPLVTGRGRLVAPISQMRKPRL